MDLNYESMKQSTTIRIGLALTALACLFPPLKFLGIRTWGFIFGNAGFGMVDLQFLDAGMLILELVVIWGFTGVIYYFETSPSHVLNSPWPHSSHKFCSECGSKIAAGDRFCSECGAKCA